MQNDAPSGNGHMRLPPRNGKRALITGITGQDGSYLAELLLAKGYEVWGMIRRASSFNTARLDHIYQDPHDPDVRLRLCFGDLNDSSSIHAVLQTACPDEVYNLGAQSHVKVSFEVPEYTGEVTALGALRLLEGLRSLESERQVLSGFVVGTVRESRRVAADGADSVSSAQPVRRAPKRTRTSSRATIASRTGCLP